MSKPNVNEKAPNFSTLTSEGNTLKLSDYLGKNVVLYFYPKDMTAGCTTEACNFRNSFDLFQEQNTVILGISPDTLDSHRLFVESNKLPFLLLVDTNFKIAEMYGVKKKIITNKDEFFGLERSTYLINKEGYIVKVWDKVKVENHSTEVLNFINNTLN
jgi:thioredoxin-dependent peroxiredoxin